MLHKAGADIAQKTWVETVEPNNDKESTSDKGYSGACQLRQLLKEVANNTPSETNVSISYKNLYNDAIFSSTGKTR